MSEAVHDAQRLLELQALPLERKIQITQARIIEWYKHYHGNVVVSFSGGKDSTVLLHLVRQIYPDVRAVFSNTGLEYPEIQRFVKSFDNVDIVTPKMRFDQVISTYGYPLISKEVADAIYYARRLRSQNGDVERAEPEEESAANSTESAGALPGTKNSVIQTSIARHKRTALQGKMKHLTERAWQNTKDGTAVYSMFNKEKYLPLARDVPVLISHLCCMEMKKKPMKKYQHKNKLYPLLGTLADESRHRKEAWFLHGCNAFESKSPTSQPLSFWTEQDILTYIAKYQVEIASVYGDIIAVDENGNEYPARELIVPACKLKCEKCDRTGQINAAR